MRQRPFTPPVRRLALTLAAAAAIAIISACGGGDDGGGGRPPASKLGGVAATGAPFTESVVRVYDRSGTLVGTSAPVGRDGQWELTLNEGAQAPFVAVASRTEATGETQSLVSVLDTAPAAGTTTRLNLSPVTTLVATRLSPSGQPLALASEVGSNTATVTAQTLGDKLAEVRTLLAPYLTAAGQTGFDPLRGVFVVDGTGFDQLLDSLYVTITPTGSTGANVEVGLRASSAGAALTPLRFDSTQPLADIVAANSAALNTPVDPAALVPAGTAVLIGDLMTRATACYALPLAERVASGGTTAAQVIAPACRSLFVGDDPASYLSNGSVVSATGSFSGLFNNGATGIVFDQGTYEFARNNGDLVMGYRSRAVSGATTYDSLVVRREGASLKLIGNQYAYSGGVTAYHQYRVFPTLAQSGFNYHSSAYNLQVNNTTAGGVPIFDRVEVQTPFGTTLVLRPSAGGGALNLVRSNGTVSGTSLLRVASAFESAATPGSPSTLDTGLVFSSPQLSDAEVAAIPAQSVWRFRYYLASDPTTLAAEQAYRTRSRALTIAEFRTRPLARLPASTLATMESTALASGVLALGAGPVAVSWEVPAGALPPVNLTLFGVRSVAGTPNQSFNDGATVSSVARSGVINCSLATVNDLHCNGTGPGFAPNTYQTGLHLYSTDSAGRGFNAHYATYDLTP